MSQSFAVTWSHTKSHWKERAFAYTYLTASKLTDSLCIAHQLYRQRLVVDTLYPAASSFEKWLRKSTLVCGALSHSFFALFTTIPGIELRLIALFLQKAPYLYFKGEAVEKQLTHNTLSLLSWNLCCVSGGYSITDGGVLPWPYRMKQLIGELLSKEADILCLYEIFDIQTALALIKELKHIYSHFYFHIGPNPVGLSSGLCIASKVKLTNPEFVPFPLKTFDGRAKHCKKGFFSFDVQRSPMSFARIYTTHLQHSEVPAQPTEGEIKARKEAMRLILAHIQKEQGKVCVLTGDLNLDESEYESSEWSAIFDRGEVKKSGCTWGGDQFCARLVGKPSSLPLNLDHTLVLKNTDTKVITSYIESGFDGSDFKTKAISDHKGLLSIITFGESQASLQNKKNK